MGLSKLMPQAGQRMKHCELKYINRDPGNRPGPAPKPLGIRAKALSPPQSYWEVGSRGNHLWSILVFLVYVQKNLQPKIEFFVHMSACLSFSTCLAKENGMDMKRQWMWGRNRTIVWGREGI